MHAILHAMAIRKHADATAIAALGGIADDTATALLDYAVETGRAAVADGRYLLTPVGQMILENQYGYVCAAARADTAFSDAYARFETLNTQLKQAITDWQTISVGGRQVPNDHRDSAYDEAVIDRIADVHERLQPMLGVFGTHSPRFARYASRLEAALERAENGEREWVSDVRIESYHTVWFEMHEDLLRMLGREREE